MTNVMSKRNELLINTSNNIYMGTTVISTQTHSFSLHGALQNNSVGIAVYLMDQRYVHLDVIIA
jgi:hypothetical protein